MTPTVELALITAGVSIVTALITAAVTVLMGRGKNRVDIQTSLNAGFQTLISELQEEIVSLRMISVSQTAEIRDCQRRLDRVTMTAMAFHNFIVNHGLIPPHVDYGPDGMKAPIAPSWLG